MLDMRPNPSLALRAEALVAQVGISS
jgi:hypothetical protein